MHVLGNPPRDLRRAAPGLRQSASPIDDRHPLRFRQLTEPVAALNPLGIARHKPLHAAVEEADPLATVKNEPAADQPLPAPARNRLGRHVEILAQLLDRVNRLAHLLHGHVGRVRHVLHEQQQIAQRLGTRHGDVGGSLGTK